MYKSILKKVKNSLEEDIKGISIHLKHDKNNFDDNNKRSIVELSINNIETYENINSSNIESNLKFKLELSFENEEISYDIIKHLSLLLPNEYWGLEMIYKPRNGSIKAQKIQKENSNLCNWEIQWEQVIIMKST